MKLSFLFLIGIFIFISTHATLSESAIPQGFEVKRYESIWKRSPFTLESVVPELQKGFATDLSLVGTSVVGTNNYVMLLDKKTSDRFLVSETLNHKGISLVSIQRDDDPTKVSATLKKGAETSIIKFDPTALNNMPKPPPMMTNRPLNMLNMPPNMTNTTPNVIPSMNPVDPKKFIRKRFPIPGESPDGSDENLKTKEAQERQKEE
ncbi:MAG: hypothetical protein K1X66_07990 [Verrucomicrobiae bacterium]|nr:hypothetical protein [Verrucomicrobiae bacterium]